MIVVPWLMAMSNAERARRYRARKGATTRTGLKPCGTLAAARRHQRRGEPLDEACQQALSAYQRLMRAQRLNRLPTPATTAPSAPPPPPSPPVPAKQSTPRRPARPTGGLPEPVKLTRRTDPRTALPFYEWQAGPVHIEIRRRRFPDGRQRWEIHHLPGSTVPPAAEWADPTGDAWTRLGDLRHDLDRLAQALP